MKEGERRGEKRKDAIKVCLVLLIAYRKMRRNSVIDPLVQTPNNFLLCKQSYIALGQGAAL